MYTPVLPKNTLEAVPFAFKYSGAMGNAWQVVGPQQLSGEGTEEGMEMARAAPPLPSVRPGACWDFVSVAKPSVPNAVSDAFRSAPCFSAAGNRQLFDQIPRTRPSHSFLFGHFENTCVCSSSPAGRAGGWGTSGLLTTPGSVASRQRL